MKKSRAVSVVGAVSSTRSVPGALALNAGAALSVLILLYHFVAYVRQSQVTTFDDAYMFMRYANNFLAGHGLAWNPDGVQTYGTTSLLYLMLVVVLRAAFPAAGSTVLLTSASAGLGLAALVVLVLTCTRFATSKVLRNAFLPVSAVLAAVFVLSPVFRFHAVTGMDTTLSLLCNSLLILATLQWVRAESRYTWLLTVLAGYLCFLARPDNLVYAVAFPACCALFLTGEGRIPRAARHVAGLCALLALDAALKAGIYGHPLPLPFYAKASGYYEGYVGAYQWNPVVYLFQIGMLVLPFLAAVAFTLRGASVRILCAFLAPVAVTFAYYFSVMQIMGSYGRYYFPAVPFFVVGSFLVVDHYVRRWAESGLTEPVGRQLARVAVIVVLVATIPQPAVHEAAVQAYQGLFSRAPREYSPSTRYATPSEQPLPELGWWVAIQEVSQIAASLPAGTKMALSEFGYVGASAPQVHIVDPVGLHDPYFAHNGFSAAELFRREPDLIWFPHPHYTKIVASMLDSRELWEQYDFYPGAFDYGLAVRRDGPNRDAITSAVRASWEKRYGSREMVEYLATPVSDGDTLADAGGQAEGH
jgi:hypothetical protein